MENNIGTIHSSLYRVIGGVSPQMIKANTVRVYYNAGNEREPFCLDFGQGTTSIVCEKLVMEGSFEFRYNVEQDPKAWLEANGDLLVFIQTAGSFVSVKEA